AKVGGTQYVYSGGTAIGARISSFASVQVGDLSGPAHHRGGTVISAVVSGTMYVLSGGVSSDTALYGSGNIFQGKYFNYSGGDEIVESGGSAVGTHANGFGTLAIGSGGMATGTVVSGGFESVFGGRTTGTQIIGGSQFGDRQYVNSGGVAVGT